MARLALLSFRLGGTDGVAIEAAKWASALDELGHEVVTVAGEGQAQRLVEGLGLTPERPPRLDELERALEDVDVVIVENVLSLPLNLAARDALYEVLEGRPAILHHHDLAWQRAHLAHLEGPRDAPSWRHVTINELSRRQLAQRGIDATTIMNSFDCDPPAGERDATRAAIDVRDETLVVLPTRALPRKNVEGAIQLARALDAVFWLLGPAEDGFGPTLDGLLADARVAVRRGVPSGASMHDVYAASDLVVMSSTWEGFGNPVLESVTHRRALALHPYPVAREIIAHGFDFFGLDDVEAIRGALRAPDEDRLERNLAVARRDFNVADLPARLEALLAPVIPT